MSERQDGYTPAALYARVSSDRQDVDLSVSAQLRALRDYAEKNGYLVAREYVDEAESGRIADRPQFRKMLEEATRPNAPFHEILVWKFSRFTRKREHAVAFKAMLLEKKAILVPSGDQAGWSSIDGARGPAHATVETTENEAMLSSSNRTSARSHAQSRPLSIVSGPQPRIYWVARGLLPTSGTATRA